MDIPVDIQELIADPRVRMGAGAVVVLLVIVLLFRRRGGSRGKGTADAAIRARQKLLLEVRGFRDDVKKAAAASAPIFRKMDGESVQGAAIGHWRTTLNHRITIRSLDFSSMKTATRGIGVNAMPLSDLEAGWRTMERQIADYNAGKLDESPTPISTIRQFEKDMQRMVVLANIVLTTLDK